MELAVYKFKFIPLKQFFGASQKFLEWPIINFRWFEDRVYSYFYCIFKHGWNNAVQYLTAGLKTRICVYFY